MWTRNWRRNSPRLAFAVIVCVIADPARGQSHSGPHGSGGHVTTPTGPAVGAVAGAGFAVGGGYAAYGFPFYSTIGPNGLPFWYMPTPPLLLIAPVGMAPALGPLAAPGPPPGAGQLLAGPLPPAGAGQAVRPSPQAGMVPKLRRADPSRSAQLTTYGDRHFRAGDLHHASERYAQAIEADPDSAAQRVRMAQIALVRGHYSLAAQHYREALTAEPGWLIHAPDIQAVYGEPSDFAKQINKLETHLQANPNDRDAWFVLGAQWFLSGKTRKAADIFVRLSDRKYDASLAAFLDASSTRRTGPR